MNDVETATVKLAELLRHPEDLDKLPALKAEFTRKKAAVDGQLRHGLKEQLELTQAGMNSITDGQRAVNLIKEEMMKIDKLCAEAQQMIKDFPNINLVAQTHKNFESVEKMRNDIDSFLPRLDNLEYLLSQDDEDEIQQPNLLQIHHGLTQLRDVRDEAMAQIKTSEDASTELIDNLTLESNVTVQELFARLDDVIEWFDKHISEACLNMIELVQAGYDGVVVRIALVIEEEEKSDKKAKALQDAQREYKDLASRFKSIAAGPKELRGYKEQFIKSIESVCETKMAQVNEEFLEDPEKLEKRFKWYFNNLNTVKLGMVNLMPKKWKIFQTYTNIYHQRMHDWLVALADDENLGAPYLLAMISWVEKYYQKMEKLGCAEESLQPHVIDNRVPELIRTYRNLIIDKVNEWMDRMAVTDKQNFLDRNTDELDVNVDGWFQTKALGDMWTMLAQQVAIAASSDRSDVAEGVIDAMFRALISRQRMWESLVKTEGEKYATQSGNLENFQSLQDYLIAVANDQIICIDEGNQEVDGRASFLTSFSRDIIPLVSQTYVPNLEKQLDEVRNGYVDLATTSMTVWCQLIFDYDFADVFPKFFTSDWYPNQHMGAITSTFNDYLNDYRDRVHISLQDILIEQLSDELLSRYLSAVRNKGVKFRRSDPFEAKIKDDILTVFQFFGEFGPTGQEIKDKWKVMQSFLSLLSSEKSEIPFVYEEFKAQYWDVQIGWVEAVLRSRDDFDRAMLNSVKAKAAEVSVETGLEGTIMSKVR